MAERGRGTYSRGVEGMGRSGVGALETSPVQLAFAGEAVRPYVDTNVEDGLDEVPR